MKKHPLRRAIELSLAALISAGYTVAQTGSPAFRDLHAFGAPGDGAYPTTGVTVGQGGVLYGTTSGGGTGGGTAFSLAPPAAPGGGWTESVLYNFPPPSVGMNLLPSMVAGKDGIMYGVTYYGGTSNYGTVFSLTPPSTAGGEWTETVLYNFTGTEDGGYPNFLMGQDGILYGTTEGAGGASYGTVFSITPPKTAGGPWTEHTLYRCLGLSDSAVPNNLALGSDGTIYGTAYRGGLLGFGTVFALPPSSQPQGLRVENILYSFAGELDGAWACRLRLWTHRNHLRHDLLPGPW